MYFLQNQTHIFIISTALKTEKQVWKHGFHDSNITIPDCSCQDKVVSDVTIPQHNAYFVLKTIIEWGFNVCQETDRDSSWRIWTPHQLKIGRKCS